MAVKPPYTKNLWNQYITGTGSTTGPAVPTGKLWVVRDVVLNNYKNNTSVYVGYCWLVETLHGTVIAGWGHGQSVGDAVFHVECRQAVPAGVNLQIQNDVGGWSVAVTGYEFATV